MSSGRESVPRTREARASQTTNARVFAATLASQGVGPVIVSPGSRSTPLVLACAEHPDLETVSVIDERSAAFFALGWARASDRPAVLLCTSGSAAGHYLPALMEADAAEIPVLVVTANRPIERESSGASQTAVQRHLYGLVVRRDYEVDLALASERGSAAVARVVGQAVARTTAPLPGPVHVDVRLRKPLEPEEWPMPDAFQPREPRRPRWFGARALADEEAVDEIVSLVAAADRPMLAVGPAPRRVREAAAAVASIAQSGLPMFCEWTSQLREQSEFWALGAGLASGRVRRRLRPDLVVQLGTAPVSAGWEPWIEQCAADGAQHIVVQSGRMRDARSTATHVLVTDPAPFLNQLATRLTAENGARWSAWHEALRAIHDAVAGVLVEQWEDAGLELRAARAAITECPGGVLGLGNSLAVRHAEGAPPATSSGDAGAWSWIWHQRGLSGIDGLIAGMAGSLRAAASEAGSALPGRLLLGDVSFVHDLGSLALLRSDWAKRLDVVMLDNGGGRIFERLPLAKLDLDPATRDLFVTPPSVDLGAAARAAGLAYHEVSSADELVAELGKGRDGARVLHVRCPPTEVNADHRRILAALDRIE